MTKEQRQEMYRAFLAEEGFVPKIDADGDVIFKFEGRLFYINVSDTDEAYFRLVFPNFWDIESEAEREKAYEAAHNASAQTKVAKVYLVKDGTWAAVEMFCSPPEVFKPALQRGLSALQTAAEKYRQAMRAS